MSRFTRALRNNLDVVAFTLALLSVAPLMAWWSVLVRRNITSIDALVRGSIEALPLGEARTVQLANLDAHTQRQLFMITGESLLGGLMFAVLAVVLFAVARHRLRENARLQSLLQLTSHQLKTPIAATRTLLQSLGNGSIPAHQEKEFLARGVAQCDRLEHMVETILAYQRTVAKRGRLHTVETQALVGSIIAHRRAMFPTEAIAWSVRSPSMVRADPDAVHVVIENLLDNGLKYGNGNLTLVEAVAGNRWQLVVSDNGQGFSPSEAERLFEPFERGGGAGVSHGSGLGLYIARKLSRAMGGDLRASSEGHGRGAAFTFELPIQRGGDTGG